MELKPNTEELIQEAWAQWRAHPTTSQLITNLNKHKQKCLDVIEGSATDPSIPDIAIRYQAVNIKNTSAIIKMISDFPTFRSMINKPN